ncbi:methyl-accepting chemotaxis protein [Photobacterium kasasachensis]|uniref:methyl-accepting chemotaxis protein n=1 Tax=Photobacterium kasasachensis TaxID=2910240 RepID=UPI003D1491A6
MKGLGFKHSLIVSIALWTILSIGAANYISYLNQRDGLINEVTRSTVTFVRDQSSSIEEFIHQKSQGLHNLASKYKVNNYTDGHIQRMIDGAAIANLSNLMIGFNDGVAYKSTPDPKWVNYTNPSTYDPRRRPWWTQVSNGSGVVFTDVYADSSTKKLMISFGETVNEGILLGDIELDLLNDVVKSIDIPGSVSMIIDSDTTILATSTGTVENGKKLTNYSHLKDIALSTVSSEQLVRDYINSAGLDKTMFTHEIIIGNKKWYLMIGLDKSITYASLDSAREDSLFTTIGFVIFGIILVLMLLKWLYTPILQLKDTVVGLSQGNGDLTQRLDVKTDDDLGQIAAGINQFIESLQKMMLEIEAASHHLHSNVAALQAQTDDNTKILQSHITETEQVVTAVEEMNSTAESVAVNAAEAAQFTQEANLTSEQSKGIVNQAQVTVAALINDVDAAASNVQKMSDETQSINAILTVIGEIAEQTNLLALNAAIEAARAGDQGRGFAVVADEVRNLASRTKASTTEIEEALERLLQGNQSMVEAMNNTKARCQETANGATDVAASLETMNNYVSEINDLSAQIATAAEEQSSVTQEVSRNMAAISEIVTQLDSGGTHTAEETANIAAVNAQLAAIVGKFRLK